MSAPREAAEVPAYFADFVPGRRGEILDAALAVFSESGYTGGTMRQIAARVGVTEPALYRYYAGKEALFGDVVATAGSRIVSEAGELLGKVQPENLRTSLKTLIEERRRKGSRIQPVMHALMLAAPHDPTLRQAFREHIATPMYGNLRTLVPRIDSSLGIRRSAGEVEAKMRAFMSLFIGHLMTSMMFPDASADDAIVNAMLLIMGWEGADQQPTSDGPVDSTVGA
jgi:AcrR family transcriptional regulator